MLQSLKPKVRKQIFGSLLNKWAIGCLSILTFQQILEASSTFWLVKLMATITQHGNFFPYLLLYLASLALPYIPQCIAYILKITWKQETQRSFINAFVSFNRNNISEWSNKGLKEQKLSILTAEGPTTIHTFIDYVWDLYTYVLSVFFNILALTIVVEPLFAVAYGISISCVVIIMKLKRRTQRQLTQKALTARIDLCQSLLAAWDNVLLGNEYNFKLWDEKTTQRLKRCLQRNVDLERFDQILAIVVAVMTSIPTLIVVVYSVLRHEGDPARLASFVVILPLLFMILSYTYQTLSLAFRWTMHTSKLISVFNSIQGTKDSYVALEKKIKWPKIKVTPTKNVPMTSPMASTGTPIDRISAAFNPVQSHLDLIQHSSRSGRLTIRGENGCGKSTALLLVKNALSTRAFFLPTHNHLSFNSETNKYSTGESLRKRLMEILEKVDVDVLLLDEWDANLDTDNQECLSQLIDEISEKKCVIEVRHR
jgi:ABC-type transport system involved in cytochrome bd biosynthesis fused ATPase/permease subunit